MAPEMKTQKEHLKKKKREMFLDNVSSGEEWVVSHYLKIESMGMFFFFGKFPVFYLNS